MRRGTTLIALGLVGALVAAGAVYFYRTQPAALPTISSREIKLTPDPEVPRRIERLKLFDPVAYARAAIAKGDFRHVQIDEHWAGTSTPGIQCLADTESSRHIIMGWDSLGDASLEEKLQDTAFKFNRALVTDSAYPYKDICVGVDKRVSKVELAALLKAPDRRPLVTDLASAARAQDLNAVTRFIADGADVNAIDQWQRTPLIWAIYRGNREIIDALMRAGALPNKFAGFISSPLIAAVETGDIALIRTVLEAGKQPTPSNRKGWHDYTNVPMVEAVEQGRADVIRLLLEYDAIIVYGWDVPLGSAVRLGCAACLETIFSLTGRSLAESEAVAKLFREELRRRPTAELTKRFARAAADGLTSSENERVAFLAAIEAHASSADFLLTRGQNVNFLDRKQADALRDAASRGDEASMMAVIKVAAERRGVIDDAIAKGDARALRALVPDRNMLIQHNTFTPLMRAATIGNAEIIEILIALGANPDERSGPTAWMGSEVRDGTALYFALEAGHVPAVKALLKAGANSNIKVQSASLFASAARLIDGRDNQTQKQIVDAILSSAPPDRRAGYANLMLYSAAGFKPHKSEDVAKILVARGADPCADIPDYHPALLEAASQGTFATFVFLTKYCPGWSPTSEIARKALQYALGGLNSYDEVDAERTTIARFLIAQKTPLPPDGDYLCRALESGNIDLATALIDAGVRLNDISAGRTALDCVAFARTGTSSAMIGRLRERGAKTAAELGYKSQPAPFPF